MQVMAGHNGRLTLEDRELACGALLELQAGEVWIPARVEWDDRWGWYALISQQPGDGGTLPAILRTGIRARWPERPGGGGIRYPVRDE